MTNTNLHGEEHSPVLSIEAAAEKIASMRFGELSEDDSEGLHLRYHALADEIRGSLLNAFQAGKIRPRSKITGVFDNSLAFMGKRAPISLNDAIAFLKSEGVALDTVTPSGAKVSDEPPKAKPMPASWIDAARSIAIEYIERHRKNDLFPSQPDVCGHVAKIMRGQKMRGPQGTPLSAAYIQRNAIQGEWWQANKP